MRLPGRVPVPPRLGAVLAGRIKGVLGCVEAVTGGIERAFRRLHRGQGIGERQAELARIIIVVGLAQRPAIAAPRQEMHLRFHGVTAEDVAAILAGANQDRG